MVRVANRPVRISSPTTPVASPAPIAAPTQEAPLPAAIPSAITSPSRGNGPQQARIEALKSRVDMRSSGARYMKRELKQMARRVAAGEKCRVVFDLDNTLFDTRARTLAVCRKFDAVHGTRFFAALAKTDVGYDGALTVGALRANGTPVDDDTAAAFARFWEQEFWSAPMMAHDDPMPETLFWAQEAHRLGIEVVFLTGRSSTLPDGTKSGFEQASVDQLRRAGLDFVDLDDVIVKPTVATRTVQFKVEQLAALRTDAYVGWFLTEGGSHVAGVEAHDPSTPCVYLPCSFDDGEHEVPKHVPRLDRVW